MSYLKKNVPVTQPVVEETPVKEPAVLTHSALGTYKGSDGKWNLVKIRFNPETNSVGELEVIPSDETSKESVNYRFKIQVVKEGIL